MTVSATSLLRAIQGLAMAAGLLVATGCETSSSSDNPCAANPCENGGTCNAGTCECEPGYSGDSCEIFETECGAVTCENGGVCFNDACRCAGGYEGAACDAEARPKFLGSYQMNRTCGGGGFIEAALEVTAGSGAARINMETFAHDFDTPIYGTLTGGTTFDIPAQSHTRSAGSCAGRFSVQGAGTFNATDSSMSMTYVLTLESTTDNGCSTTPPSSQDCTVTLTRN